MQAAAEILGKVRGERVAMLVHHSRNSVQKQWEETLVLALGGMARILRAHLPILIPMPGFSQVPPGSPRHRLTFLPTPILCRHPAITSPVEGHHLALAIIEVTGVDLVLTMAGSITTDIKLL